MTSTPSFASESSQSEELPISPALQTTATLINPLPAGTNRGNSLASKQFVTFIDLLSEGEIEGFPSAAGYTEGTEEYTNAALKDVYLNGQPVIRSSADPTNLQDDDINYKNIDFKSRLGTKDQTYISGFLDSEAPINPANEISLALQVTKDTPVSFQITRAEVDGVRLTISIPSLQYFYSGGVSGTTVEFEIQISYQYVDENQATVNTPYETLITEKVTGRSAGKYQRSYRIDFREQQYDIAQVRVVRITNDAADPATLQNTLYVASYTELVYQKLRYPHSALAAIRIDSEQIPSIPTRSYKIRGVKIKIPNGVSVDQTNGRIIYPEDYIFDGTFASAKAWCSDPAWILYDLLINTRYGLGQHVKEEDLDAYAFYAASKYSSELVSDNDGGLEPRFSTNILIQNQDDAYTLINELCSVMRCMPFWSTGALTISQDSPKTSSHLFTNANVSEAGFQYRGTSIKQRHTVVVVSYFDMPTQQVKYEVVEDHAAIAKFGIIQTEIKAFGCNSRSQAKRFGEWLLYTEGNEASVISFEAGIDSAIALTPGLVIDVADSTRSTLRRGGRIKSATLSAVIVDDYQNTSLPQDNASISVVMPDNSVQTREILSVANDVVYLAEPFTQIPNANSVWMIQTTDLQPSKWRIVSIEEKDQSRYSITGVSYNPSKYDYIERGEPLLNYNTTPATLTPAAPSSILVQELNVEEAGILINKLVLSWEGIQGISKYLIRYRYELGDWAELQSVGPSAELKNTAAGVYDFEVFSLNAIGTASANSAQKQFIATGDTALPETPTGISLLPVSEEQAILSWDRALRADVLNGGKVLIRHTPEAIANAAWKDSIQIVEAASGNQTQKIVPLLAGTYSIKFETVGSVPRRSQLAAFVQAQIPSSSYLTIQTINEHTAFLGAKNNVIHDTNVSGYNGLLLNSAAVFDSVPNLDLVTNLDALGDVEPAGTYNFNSTIDIGAKYTVRISRVLESIGYVADDNIDNVLNIDSLALFDGVSGEDVNCKLYVKNSDTGLDFNSLAWQEITNNFVTGRYFNFEARLTSNKNDENIIVTELGAVFDLQSRIETGTGTSVFSPGVGINYFTEAFYQAPQVNVQIIGASFGQYFRIKSITRTYFICEIYNSSGATIVKDYTYNAYGYGKAL